MADLQVVIYDEDTLQAALERSEDTRVVGNLEDYIQAVATEATGGVPGGTGSDRYERVFHSSQLTAEFNLVVLHGFTKHPTTVQVFDENRIEIKPDTRQDKESGTTKFTEINLLSYAPFTNYLVTVEV